MKILLSILLVTVPAWANQSLNTGTGQQVGITVPNIAIYNSAAQKDQTFRIEARIHNFPIPTSGGQMSVFYIGGLAVDFGANGELIAGDTFDSMSSWGNQANAIITGHTDIVVRLVRNTSTHSMQFRVFDAGTGALIGGHCGTVASPSNIHDCSIDATVQHDMSGGYEVGFTASGQTNHVAWVKVFSTIPPQDDAISGEFTPADLADFRFENNLTNSTGGSGVTASYTSPTYSVSPSYPPMCAAGASTTVRAPGPLTLDGSNAYSRNGFPLAQSVWQMASGPGTPKWSAHAAISPAVSALIAGGYTFQLSVTDTDGASASCSVSHGVVATDNNGVVITGNTSKDHIISPILMTGRTAWPWTDTVMPLTGDNFIAEQSTDFAPVWRTPITRGTVSVPAYNVSQLSSPYTFTVTGTGTTFKADFCGGGTTIYPDSDNPQRMILWYTNQFGTTTYRPYSIVACASDTSMTAYGNTYMFSSVQSGLTYGKMTTPQVALWINGSTNANYYDNVLAFYNLYHQTGLSKYLTAAQNLADMWLESPAIMNGESCWEGTHPGLGDTGPWCPPQRVLAAMGLFLRALEKPSIWPNLYLILDAMANYDTTQLIVDAREEAARMAIVCTGAMFLQEQSIAAPNLATYKTFCGNMVNNKFAAHVNANGAVYSPQYGFSSNNGSFGNITLNNGVNVATLTGGANWDCGSVFLGASRLWPYYPNSPTGQFSGGSSVSYGVSACSGNTLTLTSNYAGTNRTDYGATLNLMGGTIVQPFIMGYLAHSLSLASDALTVFGGSTNLTTAATARSMMTGLSNWIFTYGYRPVFDGLFYVRGGLTGDVACEPDPETANNNAGVCTGGSDYTNAQAARVLGGEIFKGLADTYRNTGDATLKANIDSFYGKLWGGSGGPGADANYLSGFFPISGPKAKDFGFSWGWGGNASWPAMRIGGLAAAVAKTYQIPFRLANFANAAKVRLTITDPSGVATATTCTVSPCAVTVDARQGPTSLYSLAYLTSGNAVISAGDTIPLTVQP